MKWVMAIIVVAFLLSTFLMYEGRGTRRTPVRNEDGTISDYEVAQINGRSLMRSELDRRLRDYLSNYSSRSAESLDMPAIYQAVLDQTILESQLAKEVEEKGITVSDADADRAMKAYADMYYPTREMFFQALETRGINRDEYKRSLARQMATERVIREAIGEIVISEDQAAEFYETMKTLIYTRPEGYMLHMADFNTSEDAEFLKAKLDAGESWDVIASSDELASHDVINITRQPVYLPTTAFSAGALSALASVDVGKASVFSMSSFDYAVGLKTEHVNETVRPYDEVSADIHSMLMNQEETRRLTEYQKSLRNKAQVVINDQELFARPAVSEDEAPAVEDVIPELAEAEKSADEAKTETPAVVSDEPEVKAEAEAPVVESAEPGAETPAPVSEEPKAETEAEAPAVESAEHEAETPAPAETSQPETATQMTQKLTLIIDEPKAETPAPVSEEPKEEAKPVDETPAPVEEVITNSEDMPLQEKIESAIEEVTQAVEGQEKVLSADSTDKPAE